MSYSGAPAPERTATATMNKKISGLSAGIGALTFGKGLVGGLLKHNQQQHNFRKAKGRARKAADRANRRIAENYKLTIGNYLADIQSTEQQWSAMIDQAMADAAFLDDYAGDVYVQRQQKLNEVFAAEAFRQQDQVVRYMQSAGFAAASGRTGNTAGRGAVQNAAQLGRNQAIAARELIGTVDAFDKQSEIDNRRFAHEKYKIGARASILPTLGGPPGLPEFQRPEHVEPPNNTLFMDVTSSLIDGVTAMYGAAPMSTSFKFTG